MKQLILQKNFLKKYFKILIFLFFYYFNFNLYAENNVFINGNSSIPKETIKNLLGKVDIKTFSNKNILNEFQKKIYETGFFSEVSISVKDKDIYVNVKENPIINFFYIEGLKNDTLIELISKKISTGEGKVFSTNKIKNDFELISDILNSLGYLKNSITYKVNKIENNKVNVFYIVNLNKKFKINRIYFVGNKYFKSSTLIDVISSSESGWWKFFSNTSFPSSERIINDMSLLKKFYLNNGFYDMQVNSSSIEIIDNSTANISFSINSGKKFFFNKVIINNNDFIENKIKEQINALFKNNFEKKIFSLKDVNKFNKLIEDILLQYDLNLDFVVSYFKEGNSFINLNVVLDKMKTTTFIDKIIFAGNNITDDKVIRNQLNFAEGDILSQKKLNKSIDNIKSTGLFKNVNYKINRDNSSISSDIIINVEEIPTGELGAGVSAGSSGAAIVGSITEKNFLGKGINLRSSINIGTEKLLGEIRISNPDFNNTGNSLIFNTFISDRNYENTGYESKVIGLNLSTKYELYENLFFSPGAGFDFDQVDITNSLKSNTSLNEGDFLTTKIFYDTFKDSRNIKNLTTSGYTFGFGQDFALFPSDIPFLKNQIFGSYYHEIYENFIGSIRYNLETINALDNDIKFSDRLYVREESLRGFGNRGIGPKSGNDYVGGNYSYNANFSSTFPNGLPDKWNAKTNIFFDLANVWGIDYSDDIDESNKIRTSIGLGFSWISPIGPIGMSYAEPLSKVSTDDIQQFNFKIGTIF